MALATNIISRESVHKFPGVVRGCGTMFCVGTYGTYVGLRLFHLSLYVSLVAKIGGRGARGEGQGTGDGG